MVVRLVRDETGVRCVRCGASAVHLAIGHALRQHVPRLNACEVCELSARGPLARYLTRHAHSVALSEYLPGVPTGTLRDGVRCEDAQNLSYADASFDLVTHTEVLEHVADDARAFVELRRVLRPGGLMLFTVPLHEGPTRERALLH
ncbi:MAG: class I SAM-dependent methyltransferase, partial [Rudaea sp.]